MYDRRVVPIARRVGALVVFLSGCSLIDLSGLKGQGDEGGSGGASTSTLGGGAQGGSLPSCEGEDCSLHGHCEVSADGPACVCDGHFDGLRCERCAEGYAGDTCLGCDAGYQDQDDDGTCSPACTAAACSQNGECHDETGTLACVCFLGFQGDTCETACPAGMFGPSCDFTIVYGVDIPVNGDWNVTSDIGYDVDESASVGSFTRVAYRLRLDDEEVWVEMDAFTDDPTHIGVPVDFEWDIPITNATVVSFATNQPSIATPSHGSLEFWSQCYDEGVSGFFDTDDDWGGLPSCYGSLQVHVAGATVFSVNAWTTEGTFEMGIGKAPNGHPDWTFHSNAGMYATRRLEVYLRP